uniref:Uncharacterized protein n=1 Tax=Oryza barthii TaxID=65489 RepID=A0A0D3HMR0_9ORYZ
MDNLVNTTKDVDLAAEDQGPGGSWRAAWVATRRWRANLINDTLSKGVVMGRCSYGLHDVLREVHAQCKRRRNRWRGTLKPTYLSNPVGVHLPRRGVRHARRHSHADFLHRRALLQ